MNTIRAVGALSLATGLLVAVGCARHPSQSAAAVPGTTPPTGVTSQQNAADQRVVEQLATARCDHEQTCNNVGPGKKYVSAQACTEQERGSTANDLNAYNCPRGIDEKALNQCMQSLRNASCGFSLSHLFSASDCGASALCIK